MRYDTPIYFQEIKSGEYNVLTGDYDPDFPIETKRYASITNTGTDTLNLVYGELKQDSLTIRLQKHYLKPFDKIRINKKLYRVDKMRKLPFKQVFIVSEIQ